MRFSEAQMQQMEEETGGVQACPEPTEILVSVRRDFPIRESEKFGAWGWSDDNGTRTASPISWSLAGGGGVAIAPDTALNPNRTDAITGWSLGRPDLDTPGHSGGQKTTDHSHPIVASVKLQQNGSTLVEAQTSGPDGEATLDTTGISGTCAIVIEPTDHDNLSAVGPFFFGEDMNAELIYRTLKVKIGLDCGRIVEVKDPYDPPAKHTSGRVGNRAHWEPTSTTLPVSLKPIWWTHPGAAARAGGVDVDMFVIHCTSGARLGNALNQWFSRSSGAHYVMDIDGHLIKLVDEGKRISHVAGGWDRWERDRHNVSNNDRSIGIEIINPLGMGGYNNPEAYVATDDPQPYTAEQYEALIDLLSETASAYPAIQHRIIGHSDVACGPTDDGIPRDRLHRRRNWDPGNRFAWEKLEANSLGMVISSRLLPAGSYSNVFTEFPGIELRLDDRDPRGSRAARLGRETRPDFVGTPIQQLKTDLRHIGYSLRNTDGTFDAWLVGAVDRFKRHFYSGSRPHHTGGNVDEATAALIHNIASQI